MASFAEVPFFLLTGSDTPVNGLKKITTKCSGLALLLVPFLGSLGPR